MSAARRGYGRAWRGLRASIAANTPQLCLRCGAEGSVVVGRELDHIVPKRLGGGDDPSNLQWLCHRHHVEKTHRERGGTP